MNLVNALETVVVHDRRDAALLSRFYDELYLPAFHHQREPLAAWTAQLWGDAPAAYDLTIALTGEQLGDPTQARLAGGVVSELYPRSGCGLLTYLVVAPSSRRAGVGRTLLAHARRSLADRAAARGLTLAAVFGEITDPRRGDAPDAWPRLERFQRWGARVVEHPYVQPSLAAGLPRDFGLRLIAFFEDDPPPTLPGPTLARFLRDFFLVTEGVPLDDDPALRALIDAIPAAIPLVPAREASPDSGCQDEEARDGAGRTMSTHARRP